MAISIDWPSSVISIPKADTTLVDAGPPEIRSLDLNTLRLALKDLEDSEAGMVWLKTHNHSAPLTVGGVQLARVVEILSPYTITFEDGNYQVNLINANSNVSDVTNLNSVGIRSANSGGLIIQPAVPTAPEVAAEVWSYTGP